MRLSHPWAQKIMTATGTIVKIQNCKNSSLTAQKIDLTALFQFSSFQYLFSNFSYWNRVFICFFDLTELFLKKDRVCTSHKKSAPPTPYIKCPGGRKKCALTDPSDILGGVLLLLRKSNVL